MKLVPFSASTKRVFEAVVEYSTTMGYNFIAPEHIAIGLFTVDDGRADRVLKRLGVNVNHLATVAVSRLQGELAKEGREPTSTAIVVTTPFLKFMAKFVLNKAQCLMTFDTLSPNGILLFRKVSKLLVAYSTQILSVPSTLDINGFFNYSFQR